MWKLNSNFGKKFILGFGGAVLIFLMAGRVQAVEAAAYFSLSPATSTYSQGSDFSILMGVNSGGEGILGIDVEGTFDATKLEMISISVVEGGSICNFLECAFNDPTRAGFDNTVGTFKVTMPAVSMSPYLGGSGDEMFARLNFRAKAVGVANVGFTCEEGSSLDCNIVNGNALDIVTCASNQGGSYTITADAGGETETPASTPVPTLTSVPTLGQTATAVPTSASGGELPQTGGIAGTLGMMVFGVVSVLGVLFLRWL